MQRTLILLLIFTVLIAVLALQNSGEVEIKLWFWSIRTSMVLLLILTFAFGALAGILFSLPGWSRRPSRKKREQQASTVPESGKENETGANSHSGGDPEFEDVKG
jgi:uncharacterized integral membrane protein